MPPAIPTTRVVIIGSTGSVGTQTLDVLTHLNALTREKTHDRLYRVVGLAANANATLLATQAKLHDPAHIALTTSTPCHAHRSITQHRGPTAAESLVRAAAEDWFDSIDRGQGHDQDSFVVVAAAPGIATLPAVLAARELGLDLALANKELLVAAGQLVTQPSTAAGDTDDPDRPDAPISAIDSEHAALAQCLDGIPDLDTIRRVTLTASGGPFRTWSRDQLAHATPEQALKHPTWGMGPKVTIDSATLTNKAFELIEARWLFDLKPDQLDAIIHPQSTIHALVELTDRSVIAQLAAPDMRLPIQQALLFGQQLPGLNPPLSLAKVGSLTFEEPDLTRFPSLALAQRVLRAGGTSGAILNAANEIAVEAFLAGSIPFTRIYDLQLAALEDIAPRDITSLHDVLAADEQARGHARAMVARPTAARTSALA